MTSKWQIFTYPAYLLIQKARNGRKTSVKLKLFYNTKQNQLAGEQRRHRVSMAAQCLHAGLPLKPWSHARRGDPKFICRQRWGLLLFSLYAQVRLEARRLDSCPRHSHLQCRRERVSTWVCLTPKLLAHSVPFLSTLPSPLPVPWRRLWPAGGKIPIRLFQLIFSSTLEASLPVASPVRALSPPHC